MRHIAAVVATTSMLAGCTVAGTPTAAPVTDEWRQAVFEAVSGLGTQLGPIANAMVTPDRMTDYTALHNACSNMRSYLDSMQHTVLPGPDVKINEALQDGIDGFGSMADQCVALTPNNSSTRLDQLGATMEQADKHIKAAIKMLNAAVPKG